MVQALYVAAQRRSMSKKHQLTQEGIVELFSKLDDSGVLDPGSKRKPPRVIDPLSGDDPSGSVVDRKISRASIAFLLLMLVLVLGMQIWYGVSRRLNTANLSEVVNERTVRVALEGGLEWGNGFTQFPVEFTVDEADERTGVVEVTVVDTDAENELELFSNSQLQAAALATNALLNDNINQVVYNVNAVLDTRGNVAQDRLFGLLPAEGTERTVFSFVWTKHKSEQSSNIDWELRIIGIDEDIAARIQDQVNSMSSLIEDPAITQDDADAQQTDRDLSDALIGSEALHGGEAERSLEDVLPQE